MYGCFMHPNDIYVRTTMARDLHLICLCVDDPKSQNIDKTLFTMKLLSRTFRSFSTVERMCGDENGLATPNQTCEKKNTFKSHREAYKATTLVLYTHRSVFSFVRPSSGLGRDNAEIMSPMLKINKYIYGVWQRISQKLAMMMARIRKSIISYVAECRNTPYYVPRLKNTTIHLMKMDDIDPPI